MDWGAVIMGAVALLVPAGLFGGFFLLGKLTGAFERGK